MNGQRMNDGDDIFNPENIEATIKVLDSYIKKTV